MGANGVGDRRHCVLQTRLSKTPCQGHVSKYLIFKVTVRPWQGEAARLKPRAIYLNPRRRPLWGEKQTQTQDSREREKDERLSKMGWRRRKEKSNSR